MDSCQISRNCFLESFYKHKVFKQTCRRSSESFVSRRLLFELSREIKSFSITDVSVFFTVSFTDIRNCVEFYISTIKSFILTLCVIDSVKLSSIVQVQSVRD